MADKQPSSPPGPQPTRTRIDALDALRGFALCGIIFINIPQTMGMLVPISAAPDGLRIFVLGRFYPIFYVLFGIGFGLFLRSAARRTDRPRVPMIRRLLALAVLGGLHHLLQPGEVLLPFAITGLLVLLPASYAPPKANLWLGTALTIAGVLIGVGGFGVLPGLFVLGFALAQSTLIDSLPRLGKSLAWSLATFTALSLATFTAASTATDLIARWLGLLFSMSMSGAYACAFLLLLRTPAGSAISTLLVPLGRMALTNYITATLLFVLIGPTLDLPHSTHWTTAALLAAAILTLQLIWSPLWLHSFTHGPLEWLWRTTTYWHPVPLRTP